MPSICEGLLDAERHSDTPLVEDLADCHSDNSLQRLVSLPLFSEEANDRSGLPLIKKEKNQSWN